MRPGLLLGMQTDTADTSSVEMDIDDDGDDNLYNVTRLTENVSVPGKLINTGELANLSHEQCETIVLKGKISKVACTIVPDTGASHSVINAGFVVEAGLASQVQQAPIPLQLNVAGNTQVTLTHALATSIQIGNMRSHIVLYVMPSLLDNVDVIIGMNWLRPHAAVIETARNTLAVTVNGKQYCLQGTTTETIGLAALQQCKEHPQFISAKQAERAMRKGCKAHLFAVQLETKQDEIMQPCSHDQLDTTKISTEHGIEFDTQLKTAIHKVSQIFAPHSTLPTNKALFPVCPTQPDAPTPYRKPYRLSPLEQKEVEKQVSELLAKGFIEPSCSPYGAPVLFVQKKDGTLRMCIDYRALNKHTIRDHFPIPRIDTLLDNIGKNLVFTTLDLQAGYHQMLLHETDMPKTAFVTHMGQYQFKVLCFGLTNAPSAFQRLMNSIFKDLIDARIVQVYLDDILVMSETPEQHLKHLDMVFARLQKHNLRVKLSKCDWAKTEVKFLGHIIGHGTVRPDPAKIEAILKWPIPRNLKSLQGFLGMVNFFREHVDHLSCVAAPLTHMTSASVATMYDWHNWRPTHMKAFKNTKKALAEAATLQVPDINAEFTLYTDASDVGCGGTLLQHNKPIAFYSHKFTSAESRYPVHDREALSLFLALKQWRCYLENADNTVCLTDHKPLVHLLEQSNLNRRQSRWLEYMARFPLCIKYVPGQSNVVADALSRYSGVALASLAVMTRRMRALGGEENGNSNPANSNSNLRNLDNSNVEGTSNDERSDDSNASAVNETRLDAGGSKKARKEKPQSTTLMEDILSAYEKDPLYSNEKFTNGLRKDVKGIWRLGSKVVVPNDAELRARVLKAHHDTPFAGHRGVTKTLELVERLFWWPGLKHDVETHVKTCNLCQRMKSSNLKKAGLLQPLEVPEGPWRSVSMDLITALPQSEGYDSILVFVDRFSKYVLCIPTTQALDAKGFAKLFINHVVAFHGMPDEVVSDRGPQFTSLFWKIVCKALGIERCLSSAYHPESDGQTERVNRILEDVLRHFVSLDHKDWVQQLPLAQFAINNSWHESTRFSPFYLNHGRHPRLPGLADLEDSMDVDGDKREADANVFAKKVKRAIQTAKQCLWAAQDRMKAYVNQHRREVIYKDGDMVLLSTRNFRTREGSKKLMPRWVGPFEVREMVGKAAVRLHLSAGLERLHNVFHVSLVKPYRPRNGEQAVQVQPLPWLIDDQGEPQYEVEAVLGHQCVPVRKGGRKHGGVVPGRYRITAYFVKWLGYDESSWVENTPENVSGCKELIEAYRKSKGLNEPEYI